MNIRQFTAEMARQNQEALMNEEEQLNRVLESIEEFSLNNSTPNYLVINTLLTERQVEALRGMNFEVQTEDTVVISW